MDIYLVGGAVRDRLLGFDKADRDWVVVGATPQQMLAQGYTQVGRDFPVFLHPQTKEEYALARTERKTGPGYTGFAFNADPGVTLEEDLLRRDLTLNAIAEDANGHLIDPYGGARDIEQRVLRHVSPAFTEDPLRVLRVARFAARFASLGFTIADETLALMRTLSESGELQHLVAERVWQETEKALRSPAPQVYFHALRECGALQVILPELDRLFGIPQPPQHHPEIDTGVHVLMCVEQASRLSDDPVVRFATLLHDLGKGVTPKEQWPHHYGHETLGLPLIRDVCERLRVPKRYAAVARLVCEYHTHCHRAAELKPATVLRVLEALDTFRRPEQLAQFLLACEADSRGRTGFEERPYPQADILRSAAAAARAVDVPALLRAGNASTHDTETAAETIKTRIAQARTQAIASALGR
ncbi:MAG: multifunctional CCA addition/repair protein [Pseudomonadales bacterium]|nr:multifunctional CCA addition/repair protein [Pseudomonadales bacterium]MCP5356942.1 multifunctional CCA addition/repair protein [Pseudomonadales bacterium]